MSRLAQSSLSRGLTLSPTRARSSFVCVSIQIVPYRVDRASLNSLQEPLRKELDDLESQGIIRKVTELTAWLHPIVLQSKNKLKQDWFMRWFPDAQQKHYSTTI